MTNVAESADDHVKCSQSVCMPPLLATRPERVPSPQCTENNFEVRGAYDAAHTAEHVEGQQLFLCFFLHEDCSAAWTNWPLTKPQRKSDHDKMVSEHGPQWSRGGTLT